MPRKTRKSEIDEIVHLAEEGFTDVEISEKTGKSIPTVRKYRKRSKADANQLATIAAQQKAISELQQKVEQLEASASLSYSMNKLPTQCPNGHSLILALRCIDPDCHKHGEFWGTVDGSSTYGPMKLGRLQGVQNYYLQYSQIPMAEAKEQETEIDDEVPTAHFPGQQPSVPKALEGPLQPSKGSDYEAPLEDDLDNGSVVSSVDEKTDIPPTTTTKPKKPSE